MDENTRIIPLSKGQVAIVDAADYEWLSKYSWYVLKRNCGEGFYAVAYAPKPVGKKVYMHRLILGLTGSTQTDHKNRNTLDNRRCNLRPATASQNRCNVRKPNKTGYKGVQWHKGKWVASITINGAYQYLGRFAKLEDAALAYNTAATKYEGEFAVLNAVKP